MCPLNIPDEMTIKSLWKKLESDLRQHKPDLLDDLNPPATDAEVEALQSVLNVKLPSEFVDFITVHNGQGGEANPLFREYSFFSTTEIANEWRIWKNLFDTGAFANESVDSALGVAPEWWLPTWIPFTGNGEGDHLCIDLTPSAQGVYGQIITLWHDAESRKIMACGIYEWFDKFVDSSITHSNSLRKE